MQSIIEETKKYYALARTLYPKQFTNPDPIIDFKLRGVAAGKAWLTKNKIQYQPKIASQNLDDFLKSTVPHEVAHIVAWVVYGDNSHGEYWQHVMKRFGVTNITRCHSYDVTNVVKLFPHSCACKTHQLSKIRHNKILKGHTYFCTLCKQKLK
jgi:SprT protein